MRGLRIGVVKPFSPFSRRIRKLIEDRGFPVIELKLFENREKGGSTLTEFQEEIVVTQALDAESLPHLDLMFLSGDEREELSEYALAAADEGVVTVVYGVSDIEAPIILPGINSDTLSEDTRLLRAARAPSILLGSVLAALTRSLEIREARATVVLPASDKGDEGIAELHKQVANILNFQSPPTDVFTEQLAFNVINNDGEGSSEIPGEIIARESSEIAGLEGSLSVMSVHASIFHGYALTLWIRSRDDATTDQISKAIRASSVLRLSRSGTKSPSPVSVSESDKIHVGGIRRDESTAGGFWLWVVSDEMAIDPAAKVIPSVEKLLGINPKH